MYYDQRERQRERVTVFLGIAETHLTIKIELCPIGYVDYTIWIRHRSEDTSSNWVDMTETDNEKTIHSIKIFEAREAICVVHKHTWVCKFSNSAKTSSSSSAVSCSPKMALISCKIKEAWEQRVERNSYTLYILPRIINTYLMVEQKQSMKGVTKEKKGTVTYVTAYYNSQALQGNKLILSPILFLF